MSYNNLREFIERLEREGELVRVAAEVSPVEEIAEIIGVDSLGYLSIEDVVKLADNTQGGFCTACFGGGYPTAVPQDSGKDRFECKISERKA